MNSTDSCDAKSPAPNQEFDELSRRYGASNVLDTMALCEIESSYGAKWPIPPQQFWRLVAGALESRERRLSQTKATPSR
jgi:hypothetical protein